VRWPGKLGRAMDAVQALRDDRDRLAAELERERQQHFADVFLLVEATGLKSMQFGNVARLWPEQLEEFRELARRDGHQLIIVTGAAKCHGVYWANE
jgi:Trm5-related predicted tRNA methylase